jgi:peptide/nickel transport system permease protein
LKEYLAKRLLQTIPSILAILVLTFFLIHTMSGDPISMIVGEGFETDPAFVERMRSKFGLDKPLHIQFILYITNALQGDFGYSIYGPPVTRLILERLPATLMLTGTGLLFALIIGTLLGVLSASKPSSLRSGIISTISVAGYAIPVFWLAQMMVLLFALQLGWLPVSGMTSLRKNLTGINHVIDVLKHLLLPALALGIHQLALISRLTRSSMLEVLREDYIVTAKAKGLNQRKIIYWHALRNAILPVVTITGMQLGFLLAGAVLTETVFSWPGIGRLMYTSLLSRDYPVLMGIFIVISISVIIANLVTDTIYAYLDPRIQYE